MKGERGGSAPVNDSVQAPIRCYIFSALSNQNVTHSMRGGSEKDTLLFFPLIDRLQALFGFSVTQISAVCHSQLVRCCLSAILLLLPLSIHSVFISLLVTVA